MQWGARDLITLLEPHEFRELAIPDLPTQARTLGLRWLSLPITDGEAPDHRFLDRWTTLGLQLVSEIKDGARVVVHCKGELGCAGTVACLLLLESGVAANASDAMLQVRAVRRGAIETSAQETFLRAWPWPSFGAYI